MGETNLAVPPENSLQPMAASYQQRIEDSTSLRLAESRERNLPMYAEHLGHASTAFTLDTYAHVLPHMQDEAVAKVEAMLFGATSLESFAARREWLWRSDPKRRYVR